MAGKRKLRLWEALAMSLALVAPTLAMSGNGQGLISQVGSAVPLVFLLGFIGVSLVAYGFMRLTRRYNHAGSAYALAGVTMGPRAGFVAGFALLGTYVLFALGTAALFGNFVNALLAAPANASSPVEVAWIVPALVALLVAAFLNTRDTRTVAQWLLVIEGVGIVAMVVLTVVILGAGGSSRTGMDFEVFSPQGVGMGPVLAAVVAAFLSWAGFEACAALGEETDDPHRNVPRALFGSVLLTGVLFVVVMFAQTVGFGTDARGLAQFGGSDNTLGDLSGMYIGGWFEYVVLVTAVMSAFACSMSAMAAASRLMFALARDGFGPRLLAGIEPRHGVPRNAVLAVTAVAVAVDLASYLSGRPVMGTGNPAIDSYFYFAVTGATCLLFVYLMVELAVFAASRRGLIPVPAGELVIPAAGAVFIVLVIWYGLKDQTGFSPAYLAVIWVLVGVAVALAVPRLARRIGSSLSRELAEETSLSESAGS